MELSEAIQFIRCDVLQHAGISRWADLGCGRETFFGNEDLITKRLIYKELKPGPWYITDDTVMAIGIYKMLEQDGKIDQVKLAAEFARNYQLDDYRGYGGTAHAILRAIGEGEDWKTVSSNVFAGMGSMGNGAAMRVAPLGAYFHDDVEVLCHCREYRLLIHWYRTYSA